jgi:MFS family permease
MRLARSDTDYSPAVAGHGEGDLELPDGRTVPIDQATSEELDLAIARLEAKSAAHAGQAERLAELRRAREVRDESAPRAGPTWMTRGVAGIGGASFLADLGHEVPTALLPSFLTSTLGAPAATLGLIEGIADGLAGATRFAGGPLADDPHRRRSAAVGGYAATAVLSGLIGAATSVWQVGVLRAGAWAARGLRVPSRNALLADVVPPGSYGRAYGFERSMDNLGAIGGPLLALGLIAIFSTRTAIMLSVIPGFLAVGAILYAIKNTPKPTTREKRKLRFHVRPVLRGRLGRFMAGVTLFEAANMAATLMILRATDLLTPGHGQDRAAEIAIGLYVAYNAAAAIVSIPAGGHGDRHGMVRVFAAGVAAFAAAYALFAVDTTAIAVLASAFVLAGIGIGLVETAEHAAVATFAPDRIRGSAFGLLAAVQSFGNLAASLVVGLLYTLVSPSFAFGYAAVVLVVALVTVTVTTRAGQARDARA